jgi:hypothetical protein
MTDVIDTTAHPAPAGDRLDPRLSGPDDKLIRECNRLLELRIAFDVAGDTIPNDKARDRYEAPLLAEYRGIKDRLYELAGPRTPEGARAVAAAAVHESHFQLEEAIRRDNVGTWLALTCAEYVLGVTTVS